MSTQQGDAMNLQVALWGLGILATILVGLSLGILARIQKQGDDTNTKVTALAETTARLQSSSENVTGEVARLRERYDVQNGQLSKMSGARELARELVREVADVFGTPAARRRASDRDFEEHPPGSSGR